MSLEAQLRLSIGSLDLDVELSVASGGVVAVLGPNGSGKTTLLRALAGLLPLRSGSVRLRDRILEDTQAGIRIPAEERSIGYVFQNYLLFPHLSARENVAFGLRARGMKAGAARREAEAWLERMGIPEYAAVKPGSLSGGQAQRVALARALAVKPELLLLDEPLSALDAGTKVDVRRQLARTLDSYDGVTVLVTHNPVEAAGLADRQVVVEHGRVVQSGTASEIARHPRSAYVANLVGLNLIRGTADGDRIQADAGGTLVVPSAGAGRVFASFHPSAVSVYRNPPSGSPRNVWEGKVAGLDPEGDRVRISVEGEVPVVAEVTVESLKELDLSAAATVWVAVKATAIQVYPE